MHPIDPYRYKYLTLKIKFPWAVRTVKITQIFNRSSSKMRFPFGAGYIIEYLEA